MLCLYKNIQTRFFWGEGHNILTEGTFATHLQTDKLCGLQQIVVSWAIWCPCIYCTVAWLHNDPILYELYTRQTAYNVTVVITDFLLVTLSHMYQTYIIAVLTSTELIYLSSDPYINPPSCNPWDLVCTSLYSNARSSVLLHRHVCLEEFLRSWL